MATATVVATVKAEKAVAVTTVVVLLLLIFKLIAMYTDGL